MSSSLNDSPLGFVDRFRVESRLGRGGMGDVYKAYDTVLERTVAVKTLTPGNADAQAVERLLREARACARLTHPGIVTIHDVLRAEGGRPHRDGASRGNEPRVVAPMARPLRRPSTRRIDVIVRVLDALHYAHGRGVVHRDIKPTNVQLLPDGSVKLLDFGIAHITGAAAVTVTGIMSGTAHYASPEQLRGEESDARADIYSTGILAYQMLTRRRPFDGDSVAAVVAKVLREPLPAMGTSFSEAFPEIERIVRRATAKQSRDRYASAEDMKNALAAFLASSREAIVAKQAEVAATTERVVIEAKSLIASGRMAEATPLLASALRSKPGRGRSAPAAAVGRRWFTRGLRGGDRLAGRPRVDPLRGIGPDPRPPPSPPRRRPPPPRRRRFAPVPTAPSRRTPCSRRSVSSRWPPRRCWRC